METCSQFRWIEVEAEGCDETSFRTGCTVTLVGHRLFLLHTVDRTTTGHILDLQKHSWSGIEAKDFMPKLAKHSATLVEDKVLVLGLKDASALSRAPKPCPDVYAFDPLNYTWQVFATAGIELRYRYGHSADYVEVLNALVVFGGQLADIISIVFINKYEFCYICI